jgi:serine/threonine-protein kinase RsbW
MAEPPDRATAPPLPGRVARFGWASLLRRAVGRLAATARRLSGGPAVAPVPAVELDVECAASDQLDLVHDALARFWQISRPVPDEEWRMRFELAVAEVAANVIEHARPTVMSLRLSVEAGFAAAVFTYTGPGWTDLPATGLPDPMAERGRGLYLARTGVDEVAYQRSGMTVSWRLLKRL